MDAILGAVRYQ